jgi:hypothetical protein
VKAVTHRRPFVRQLDLAANHASIRSFVTAYKQGAFIRGHAALHATEQGIREAKANRANVFGKPSEIDGN